MVRPVAQSLPDDGLLVGWSLEGQRRRKIIGFASTEQLEGASSKNLEPILYTGEGHLLTVAPTGAGKGVGCIIPALLRYPGPVIAIDPKGENYRVTARRRRELGQKVVAIDPFAITDAPAEERGRFNPLDFLSPENPSLVEDAEMIATTLVAAAGRQHHDPFWPYMGGQLITLLLLYQLKELPSSEWTLTKTRELLAQNPESFIEFGKQLMSSSDSVLKGMAGIAMNPAEQTFGGYWAFSQMQTACLKGGLVGETIGSSSFSLQEIVDGEPLSIYFCIPPDKLESHGGLLKVWLTVLIAALTQRNSKPPRSTLFIVDEAAQLGEMPQLRRAVTLLRGYGVRVWSFWQDLSQLQALYPENWETILNNCHVQQFFSQVTRLGSTQTFEVTGLGSPDFLQTLARGEMALSVMGDQPVIAQAPNYLSDPPFQSLYDENPFYQEAGDVDGLQARRVYRRSEPTRTVEQQTQDYAVRRMGLAMATRQHPFPEREWTELKSRKKTSVLADIRNLTSGIEEYADDALGVRTWPAKFYPDFEYVELQSLEEQRDPVRKAHLLYKPGRAIVLEGDSNVVHALNNEIGLKLTRREVLPYLYFFCTSVTGSEGRFLIIDEPSDFSFVDVVDEEFVQELSTYIEQPNITDRGRDDEGIVTYDVTATMLYDQTLFRTFFRVHADGNVVMLDDEPLVSELPVMRDAEVLRHRIGLVQN